MQFEQLSRHPVHSGWTQKLGGVRYIKKDQHPVYLAENNRLRTPILSTIIAHL